MINGSGSYSPGTGSLPPPSSYYSRKPAERRTYNVAFPQNNPTLHPVPPSRNGMLSITPVVPVTNVNSHSHYPQVTYPVPANQSLQGRSVYPIYPPQRQTTQSGETLFPLSSKR